MGGDYVETHGGDYVERRTHDVYLVACVVLFDQAKSVRENNSGSGGYVGREVSLRTYVSS